MYFSMMESPVGLLRLTATNTHLTGVYYPSEHKRGFGFEESATQPILQLARRQLEEYFQGKRRHFDVPLMPQGTAFQQQVWAALQTIAYGEIKSYADIADSIDNPKAVRAVGTANGANPISIMIPCHRVIGSNGKLTGYAGGLEQKRILLELESGQHALKL